AKDDAAGQAISNRFTASISGLTQASRNANDGISIAQTTEGALNEVNDNLQNIRRLTVQAQNGTNSDSDRQSIQDEIDARMAEINRISDQTEFNGVKVLSQDQSLSIQVGSNDSETIDIDLTKMDANTLNMTNFTVDGATGTLTKATSMQVDEDYKYDAAHLKDAGAGAISDITDIVKDDVTGDLYAIDPKAGAGKEYCKITDDGKGNLNFDSTAGGAKPGNVTSVMGKVAQQSVALTAPANSEIDTDGKGNYFIKNTTTGNMTRAKIDIDKTTAVYTATVADTGKNATNTADPLKAIDAALSQVDKLRSGLGAVQNRFDSVISNLNNTVNNLSESRSRILDADFASEVSEMSRANILQSAGTSVLAQANQVPQNVLQLLR
ncbi:FliC/FljB family flagellin, partial [Escherichia sp. E3659]|uniref:FliC/FljB family flagellin n=1 Tax=Escherichia sp. E3659 TaxID=2044462 RepID=UPI0010FE7524